MPNERRLARLLAGAQGDQWENLVGLSQYGLGYIPINVSDSAYDPTTADVLSRMGAMYSGPGGALRRAAEAIPESPNTMSILNMGRSGLKTMANWLQGAPEIGPDTLAPFGLGAMGMALAPRNALGSAGGEGSRAIGGPVKGNQDNAITAADRVRAAWHGVADKFSDAPSPVTGGSPGHSLPPDQWSPYGVPANKHSSTGLSYYNWHGMHDARTGEPLPNPWPNYVGQRSDIEAMTRAISGRIERGELDDAAEPVTPYDAAVARQQSKGNYEVLSGGRRDARAMKAANDLLSDPSRSLLADEALRLQRAQEMGFDTSTVYYHGTDKPFDAFDPARSGETFLGRPGSGGPIYFARDPSLASSIAHYKAERTGGAPSVIPVHLRNAEHGADSREVFTSDPRNIRSVNAAFDPSKSHSSNLLAGWSGLALLGALRAQQQAPEE